MPLDNVYAGDDGAGYADASVRPALRGGGGPPLCALGLRAGCRSGRSGTHSQGLASSAMPSAVPGGV
jgi:hypothetical protein